MICFKHFVSGKPAYLFDTNNPDWLPTLNLGHSKRSARPSSSAIDRYERARSRSENTAAGDAASLCYF